MRLEKEMRNKLEMQGGEEEEVKDAEKKHRCGKTAAPNSQISNIHE